MLKERIEELSHKGISDRNIAFRSLPKSDLLRFRSRCVVSLTGSLSEDKCVAQTPLVHKQFLDG